MKALKRFLLTFAALLGVTGAMAQATGEEVGVTPSANNNEWTLTMPAGDVELVVEYYADDEPIDPDAEEVVLIDNGDGTWTITSMPAFDVELEVEYDDGTTAIISIKGGKVDDVTYYDLSGRKVAKPTKGIYIHNGKKVLIK